MHQALLIAHVVIGLFFVLFVLVQDKGSGLSATFGGSGGFYASQRGAAKVMHYLSIVFGILFFVTAMVYVALPAPGVTGPEVNLESINTTDVAPLQ